ncbi:putative mitochondrial import inner membrane translocase subunit TIM22 [Helianthus annuus]|nr:putative mitochondrial import inner membrane translocase subunit TIM22 [Helianthus annuus]
MMSCFLTSSITKPSHRPHIVHYNISKSSHHSYRKSFRPRTAFVLRASNNTDIQKWADKPRLPAGATTDALFRVLECFVVGVATKVILECCYPPKGFCVCVMQRDLPSWVSFFPLMFSHRQTPIIYARNYALVRGCIEISRYVLWRSRGKEDLESSMLAGLGGGFLMSLVTGMRGQSVIAACVIFALMNGLMFKLKVG